MAIDLEAHRKVRSIVTRYVIEHVGDMAVEGAPTFDKERRVWTVPILCRTSRGILPAGKIELDEDLNIIFASSREEMVYVVEAQLKRLPYLVYAEEGELEAAGFEPVKV